MASPLRRIANRLADPYMRELENRLAGLQQAIDYLHGDLRQLRSETFQRFDSTNAFLGGALRQIYDEELANRRRLYALRQSSDYEPAFSESEPLVSFVIPTHDRPAAIHDVSVPSILAQSYANTEVIIIGDAAPAETAEAIADLGDPRIRYYNRSVRGPYPDDESRRWFVAGSHCYNEGVALARGRWIATLGDDDAVRPDHTQTLLRAAHEQRHEHVYGHHLVHFGDGEDLRLGEFPPSQGQFGLQSSIYHAGLRFFTLPAADYLFGEPNDWSLCRRMLEAGVRFGMVGEVLADKYETRRSAQEWRAGRIPLVE